MKVGRCQFCSTYQSYQLRAREATLSRKKCSVSRAALRDLARRKSCNYLGSVVFQTMARTKIHVFCNNARYKSSFIIRTSTIKTFGLMCRSSCHLTPHPVSTICKLTAAGSLSSVLSVSEPASPAGGATNHDFDPLARASRSHPRVKIQI